MPTTLVGSASRNRPAINEAGQAKSGASWVVVFAGARDSYQVPLALHEASLLQTLVTDFYSPLDVPLVHSVCELFPASLRSKLGRRFHAGLPSRVVRSQLRYALQSFRRPQDWAAQAPILGESAGRLAAKRNSALLAYPHVASSAFAHAPHSLKVLFQMQPHPVSVRNALATDTLLPQFQDGSANELTWNPNVFETYAREPRLADFCIVASHYARQTLIENGVGEDCVAVIPYGVDSHFFVPADSETLNKFTVLFVGQMVRQKGLHHLLEAWHRLKLPNAQLRIAGRSLGNIKVLKSYAGDARFLGRLDWHALRDEYQRADLLCLPSLSDGFGLVVLEAMACGTPALITRSCGSADLVEENRNGFVVAPGDLESLTSRLQWASQNRDALRQMRGPTRAIAEQHTWARFRKQLVETLQAL
jgi:glycosyltransferase involved in cell wall biosynthesis